MEIQFLGYGLDILFAIAVLTNILKKYFPAHKDLLPMIIGIAIAILMKYEFGLLILGGTALGVLTSLAYDLTKPILSPIVGGLNNLIGK